jgi:hypothetical protein
MSSSTEKKISRRALAPVETTLVYNIRIKKRYLAAGILSVAGCNYRWLAPFRSLAFPHHQIALYL